MQKIEFQIDKPIKLSKAVIDELPFLSKFQIKKLIENKDIKINSVRAKEDLELNIGDKVVVYYNANEKHEWYTPIYTDENILIVNKRSGIEIVSENDRDLLSILKKNYPTISPVHRIDRNTEGLVIFALNKKSEKELLSAFKTRKGIIKKYALLVHGRVDLSKVKRTVYLKKMENLSKVWISEVKTTSFEPIITEFEVIQYFEDKTLLSATLVTGKTHQIRAHIAYYGYPIVGDNKYGKDKEKQMHLTANFLAFNFNKKSTLYYLNSKNFEIIPTWLNH